MPRRVRLIPVFLVLLTISGCLGGARNNAIRQAVVDEMLGTGTGLPQVLVVRMGPGEARANFGFPGDTVFLYDAASEGEFWRLRKPHLEYLFIKEITYSDDSAQVEVEVIKRDSTEERLIYLNWVEGEWRVTSWERTKP